MASSGLLAMTLILDESSNTKIRLALRWFPATSKQVSTTSYRPGEKPAIVNCNELYVLQLNCCLLSKKRWNNCEIVKTSILRVLYTGKISPPFYFRPFRPQIEGRIQNGANMFSFHSQLKELKPIFKWTCLLHSKHRLFTVDIKVF